MAAIVDRLDDPYCRLLTLVGPGGIGKTRLAIEVASRQVHLFPDGVYFVGLQPITSIDHIVPTVASAVGFEFYDGHNPTAQLLHYLHEQCLLLILDNFEHLLPASGLVMELLNGAPQLKVLVTTRASLNLRDEWLYHLDGLPFPQNEAIDAIDAYSAVQLFVERARRVRHDFSQVNEAANVVRVCQLVEGMPLGIELAATWLRRLPCSEVAMEIQRGLDFLETDMGGVPDRHHSMRAVFDHSWKLLNAEERSALMGLSIFRGGFRREAAELVVGASLGTLSALVDKSMLKVSSGGRYEIHELQRQYAEERLDEIPEEKKAFHDRHCAYFTKFICRPEREFIGAANKQTLEAVEAEIDNVRAAWNYAVEHRRVSDLFRALRGLYWVSWVRTWFREGEQAFEHAVAALRDAGLNDEGQVALGLALAMRGAIDIWQGRAAQARAWIEESVAILRPLDARPELAWAVGVLGWAAYCLRDWEIANRLLVEASALHEETGQYDYQGFMLNLLGEIAASRGDYEASEHWQQQALTLGRRIGDQRTIADALSALGELAQWRGQYTKARQLYEESLSVAQAAEIAVFTIIAFRRLGKIAEVTGELEAARYYVEESIRLVQDNRNRPAFAWSMVRLASVMAAQGELVSARKYYLDSLEIMQEKANHALRAAVMAGLGNIEFRSGDYEGAGQHYADSLSLYHQIGDSLAIATNLASLARIEMAQGEIVRSRQHLLESMQQGIALAAPPIILDSMVGIAELLTRQGNLTTVLRLAALIIDHPASTAETKKRAEVILTSPEAKLLAADLEKAFQQAAPDSLDVEATRLVEQLASFAEQPLVEPLSERELAVLQLVAAGKSNREIARDLTLALGTVKSHLHNIMQKLDAGSRTEAVTRARNLRLL